jgi:hypothetical protein
VSAVGFSRNNELTSFKLREEVQPAFIKGDEIVRGLHTALDLLAISV